MNCVASSVVTHTHTHTAINSLFMMMNYVRGLMSEQWYNVTVITAIELVL